MIPWGLLACILFAFGAGLVVGIYLAIWIREADDAERERRDARKRHPVYTYDWRDELTPQERWGQ